MDTSIEIHRHGVHDAQLVRHLWEALFNHHVAIGAAGIPTIPQAESWPRRKRRYERLFANQVNAGIWIASSDGERLGYAMAYEDVLDDQRVMVLETLSVLASARGLGIGTALMNTVDTHAHGVGVTTGVVDVMGGNPRARELYVRHGYVPHSETWMRSIPPAASAGHTSPDELTQAAERLGLEIIKHPGPDDTWTSPDWIVELSMTSSATRHTLPIAATTHWGATISTTERTKLAGLVSSLAGEGFWTTWIDLPPSPQAEELRAFLNENGFRLSTERLVRTL